MVTDSPYSFYFTLAFTWQQTLLALTTGNHIFFCFDLAQKLIHTASYRVYKEEIQETLFGLGVLLLKNFGVFGF